MWRPKKPFADGAEERQGIVSKANWEVRCKGEHVISGPLQYLGIDVRESQGYGQMSNYSEL